jgi:Ca-activated chloride channel family protein
MTFLEPMAWALAVSLALVVLLHLLKRRRRRVPVSSLVLWERFLQDTRASHPFQRLRHSWLLVLQLLALTVLVMGLARPARTSVSPPAPLRVLILDASASMRASDVAPSRFEQARARALRLVAEAAPEEELAVIRAGARPELVQTPTRDHAGVRRVLETLEASDEPGRLLPALRLAEALVRHQPEARLELFTDGTAGDWEEGDARALPLTEHRVGTAGHNLGVVACEARVDPEPPHPVRVVARLSAFSDRALSGVVELRAGPEVVERRPVVLQAGESVSVSFFVPEARPGLWELVVETRDDLEADNRVWLAVSPPRPVRVLLVSPGNVFLERALRSLPRAQCRVAAGIPADLGEVDVLVLDRVTVAGPLPVPVLAWASWPWEPTDRTKWVDSATPVLDWDPAHPVLRHVRLDDVHAARVEVRSPPPGAEVLAECGEGPMLLAGERGGQRFVWAGFSPLDSDWPLRVSFPIFVANAVEWLAAASATKATVRAGEPVVLRWTRPGSVVRVTGPDQRSWSWRVEAAGDRAVFEGTERCGVYRFEAGGETWEACVNLLNEEESNLRARRPALGALAEARSAGGTAVHVRREYWAVLATAFLLLSLTEWWWYHRRSV